MGDGCSAALEAHATYCKYNLLRFRLVWGQPCAESEASFKACKQCKKEDTQGSLIVFNTNTKYQL